MNPQVWVASGHVGGFSDPLMDCRSCHTRHRADKLIEDASGIDPAGWSFDEMSAYIKEHNIVCPDCGECNFTDIRTFNLMYKTYQGVTEDAKTRYTCVPKRRRASSSTSSTCSARRAASCRSASVR